MKKQGSIQVTLVGKGEPKSCLNCAKNAPEVCAIKWQFDTLPQFKTDIPVKMTTFFVKLASICHEYKAEK